MIDERYSTLIEQLGMLPGSSWRANDGSYIIMVLDELDKENEESRQWCRVLRISVTSESVTYDTMFWPYLIGLARTERIVHVK
jgi:hypothetical protein